MVLWRVGQGQTGGAVVIFTEKTQPQAQPRTRGRGTSLWVDEDQGEPGQHAGQERTSKQASVFVCLHGMECEPGTIPS